MIFNIERTSDFCGWSIPIESQKIKCEKEYVSYDINASAPFRTVWSVEIKDLNDLLSILNDAHEEIILKRIDKEKEYDWLTPQPYSCEYAIEIYDDWRE